MKVIQKNQIKNESFFSTISSPRFFAQFGDLCQQKSHRLSFIDSHCTRLFSRLMSAIRVELAFSSSSFFSTISTFRFLASRRASLINNSLRRSAIFASINSFDCPPSILDIPL
ncbi:hypothetical protein PENTCL1PPCAC_3814, partial [Pristionchus entomophagus]